MILLFKFYKEGQLDFLLQNDEWRKLADVQLSGAKLKVMAATYDDAVHYITEC
jgi:hypothetical protein